MKLVLADSKLETTGIQTFFFAVEQPVDYIAGQFIELTLPHDKPDGRGIRRWFTLSSSPTEEYIAITLRVNDQQSSFKHTLQRLRQGEPAIMSDLLGDFVLPLDEAIPLVWIAGGIGITPFRSMAKWLVDTGGKREITLFHSARNRDELLFGDIFESAGVNQSHVTHSGSKDFDIQKSVLSDVKDTDTVLFYISGPEQMAEETDQHLRTHGISNQRIITDSFLGY